MERHEMVFLSLLSGAFVCNWNHQSAHWKRKYFPLGCRQIQVCRDEAIVSYPGKNRTEAGEYVVLQTYDN